ncbi:methyl-accepting chemotaxis protein [Vibrio mangrovi]|uniref:Methyl-accepting chemotaxis protein n=1 Tax=Vibrio mangrovi TaxID=474394 RepID=A0A1Y6IY94_9VIBR|nr:methyl-accepting chemotaxis protein [Vibrio mangrovi]MDW6005022.1 methyl-accepting chemotaxis protein [Vibrio mangrovi]SMS01790.1 Methyl-accepting chemotaxis protein PctC [Vibrio mangrovi]
MFKNLSLKNKLAISASLAIIFGCLLVEIISFKASLDRLDVSVEQRLSSTTASYNQYVTDWLRAKELALTSLSEEIQEGSIITHLKQMKHAAGFENVFLAYPDGSQKNADEVVLPPGNDDPRKWGWYIHAKENPGKVFMDNPTVAAATGKNVVSLGQAVNLLGQALVLGADIELNDILNNLNKVILPGEGHMFIVNDQGNIFIHQDASLLNQNIAKLGISYADIQDILRSGKDKVVEIQGEESVLYAQPIENTRLATVTVISEYSLTDSLYHTLYGQLMVTGVLVILGIALFNWICNLLFRPLRRVSDALEQIAGGSGDLTQRIEVNSNDEVGKLAHGFNTFVGSLQQLMLHIRQQSDSLTQMSQTSTERVNQTVEELSAQQQEITMVATAVTEMSSATQEIASHAEQTAHSAQSSSESTQHGHQLVMNTKESINRLASEVTEASSVISELDQHSAEISAVLATIQGIAEQTNLLALNAAIEAARAGEQGRGFAVVADEVRVLSQRTHTSTEEIKSTIDTLQEMTKRAVGFMENSAKLASSSVQDADNASQALEEILTSVGMISDMATQIATAAEEQTHVTGEITQNVTAIKDVTDGLANGAEEGLRQTREMKDQAIELNSKVATFKLS